MQSAKNEKKAMNTGVNARFLVIVECAIEHNGRFLLIKRPAGVHAEGLLAFPGGKVEIEDGAGTQNILTQAVKREVFEEVGLELIDPLHFVTSSYFIDTFQEPVLDAIFHCKLEKTFLEIKASAREVPEYFWLSYAEILAHENTPVWLKQYMACILNR
jgi:8-oxo-dGTP pyrophosphatase MutT (NUDIX family)